MPIYLTVAVWGETYLELFLENILPTFLTPGNIPAVRAASTDARFYIYTKSSQFAQLKTHPLFEELQSRIDVRLVSIEEVADVSQHKNVYETLNVCHLHFIALSEANQAAMMFLCPDTFWSKNSFASTLRYVKQGKRAILIAGIRGERESILAQLLPQKDVIAREGLSGSDLVSLMIQHPHRITRSLTLSEPEFDIGWPSHLYWKISDEGYLAHCLHLHTFFVYPRITGKKPELAHDYDWLSQIGLSKSDIHVINDSDEVCALELSEKARGVNGAIGRPQFWQLAEWTKKYAAPDHRRYVLTPIRYHKGPKPLSFVWSRKEIQTRIFVRAILAGAFLLRHLAPPAEIQGAFKSHWNFVSLGRTLRNRVKAKLTRIG